MHLHNRFDPRFGTAQFAAYLFDFIMAWAGRSWRGLDFAGFVWARPQEGGAITVEIALLGGNPPVCDQAQPIGYQPQ